MFRILVVDDSAFDRRIVSSILQQSQNYQVTSANNGHDALRILKGTEFQLVITDLNMPEMDGLTLVREIHRVNADLPTIVVTAYGSEATAMRALQSGAYSYVPKFHLQDELASTVESVLNATSRRREEDQLLCSVVRHVITLSLPNDRQRIAPTIEYLRKLMDAMNLLSGSNAVQIGMALEEALSNAIIHGNLEVSSKLRERDDNAYGELIEERRATAPYANRRVTLDIELNRGGAQFVIRDEGPGFDFSALPDPFNPENLLRPSGRGLTIMHAFLDEVKYNRKGNEVTLRMNATKHNDVCENPDVAEQSVSPALDAAAC